MLYFHCKDQNFNLVCYDSHKKEILLWELWQRATFCCENHTKHMSTPCIGEMWISLTLSLPVHIADTVLAKEHWRLWFLGSLRSDDVTRTEGHDAMKVNLKTCCCFALRKGCIYIACFCGVSGTYSLHVSVHTNSNVTHSLLNVCIVCFQKGRTFYVLSNAIPSLITLRVPCWVLHFLSEDHD